MVNNIKCHKQFQETEMKSSPGLLTLTASLFTLEQSQCVCWGTCPATEAWMKERGGSKESQQRRKKKAVTTALTEIILSERNLKWINYEILKLPKRNDEIPDDGNKIGSVTNIFLPSPTSLNIAPRILFLKQTSDCVISPLWNLWSLFNT